MQNPGPVPHVGGPVVKGAPNVLIGGMPAARVGDTCVCTGPPDVIAAGSVTVMIGGMPAARMNDMTSHGGVVLGGCPTVLIGDSPGSGSGGGAPGSGGASGASGGGGEALKNKSGGGGGGAKLKMPMKIPGLSAQANTLIAAAIHHSPLCEVCSKEGKK